MLGETWVRPWPQHQRCSPRATFLNSNSVELLVMYYSADPESIAGMSAEALTPNNSQRKRRSASVVLGFAVDVRSADMVRAISVIIEAFILADSAASGTFEFDSRMPSGLSSSASLLVTESMSPSASAYL